MSTPGHFVAVNSLRSMEQDDENIHLLEGYLCASAWLHGIIGNPHWQPQTPRRNPFPHMYIVEQMKVNLYLRDSS